MSHAYGAVFDNPDLIAATVVGDGEAETGPLATAWQSNKFLDPITDGAVLPVLHLNGYKINNPTLLSRITREELDAMLKLAGKGIRAPEQRAIASADATELVLGRSVLAAYEALPETERSQVGDGVCAFDVTTST